MNYVTGVLVGEGGMGKVYRAVHPVTGQAVALKVLQSDATDLVERFFREARAQAKVDHPCVCKVYDVGQLDGRPYIAMQFIDGQTLDKAASRMRLEEKIGVLRDVALAAHAAHRLGLIHRDIKPSNILVEDRREEGWHPYITDFGLVKDAGETTLTGTGETLGTPPYMAPEQARGDAKAIERRTDVYGLGAVLYELLVGRPPFEGGGAMSVLVQVLQSDVVPPRRHRPQIPRPLEVIALNCLAKEPERRYDSARALADDLQRYLDGEPIHAQPPSVWARAFSRVRKNKLATASIAGGLVASISLLGLWSASKQQARWVQHFGQKAAEIEFTLRQGYLLPLHDNREEKTQVRARMDELRAEMKQAGASASAAGRYALGRGYLALHEYEPARVELDAAWNNGFHAPEVADALGRTLGVLYSDALTEAARLKDKELRERRIKEIETQYRDPAVRFLKSGVGAWQQAPAYSNGLIAYYEHRDDDAVREAQTAFAQSNALYDAKRLEGDVYARRAIEKLDRGDLPGQLEETHKAQAAYRAAIDIARSDETVYHAECERCTHQVEGGKITGTSIDEAFASGLDACTKAAQANPDDGNAYLKLSRIHQRRAEYDQTHGADPMPHLEQSIQAGERAVALLPQNAMAHNAAGSAYMTLGRYQLNHGKDPRVLLEKAGAEFERVTVLDPTLAHGFSNLGTLSLTLGMYQRNHGLDPLPAFARAEESYEKSLPLNRAAVSVTYQGLGVLFLNRGDFEATHGIDPIRSFDRSVEMSQKAAAADPSVLFAYNNAGVAQAFRATYEYRAGKDPSVSIEAAMASLATATGKDPKYVSPHRMSGRLFLLRARWLQDRGEDPTEALSAADRELKKAASLDAKNPETATVQGTLATFMGERETKAGRSPQSFFETARTQLALSTSLNPDAGENAEALAGLELAQAEWEIGAKKDASEEIQRGREILTAALKTNPENARARAFEAVFLWMGSSDEAGRAAAAAELEKAEHIDPLLKRELGPIQTRLGWKPG